MRSESTFSGSGNEGLQMGQNLGTVNTTFAIAAGATVHMGGSSAPSPEDQFLNALIANDANIGVHFEPPGPGTCLWILPELRAWQTGSPNHPLWISGSPGCGKSVMASFIIKERQNWIPAKEGANGSTKIIVAGSFCDKQPNHQTPIWILRSLLFEIFKQNRDLIDNKDPDFWQNCDDPNPILNTDSFESMESLAKLLGRIATNAELYLVVDGQYQQSQDALDLCNLIHQVSSYCEENAFPRWILSTRPNSFDRLMPNAQVIDLFEKNRDDIRIVAQSRMKHFQQLNPALAESFFDDVGEMLTQRAEGMFLWLSLALKSLGDGTIWDISIVKEKLQSIPYDVQAIYGNTFENIDEKMQTLLRWVYVAGRPLKINEVLVMWSLGDKAKSIKDIEKKSLRPETVRSSLESGLKVLLTLHEDTSIRFTHPSVEDFTRQLFNDSEKGVTLSEMQKQMAEACLAYLNLEEIQANPVPEPPVDANGHIDREKRENEIERYLGKFHFLEYSIKFLGLHLRESEMDNVPGMDKFLDSKSMQQWVRGYDLLVRCTQGKYAGNISGFTLLFISARMNLTSLAKRSVSLSLVNVPGMEILSRGVRNRVIDLPNMDGWRALHVAADSEAENVLVWLLKNGASVDSETVGIIRPGRTALHFAASKSSDVAVRIVQSLLEEGANPGLPTRFGGNTPLHYAVQGGSVEIVTKLLLHEPKQQKRADPNTPNYSGVTALHKAVAVPGSEAIVEALLQNGANPEQASALDRVAIVRGVRDVYAGSSMLSPKNTLQTATDKLRGVATNQTALHIAVRAKGREETVKKLLEWYTTKKLMVESKDSMGYTPLHSAVDGVGCSTYTRLLVESKRVDINAQDNKGRTPLILYMQRLRQPQLLSDLGDQRALSETLDVLLNAGAAPGTGDKDGKSAIDYAKQAKLTWAVEKFNSVLPTPGSNLHTASQPQTESTPGIMGKGLGRFLKR